MRAGVVRAEVVRAGVVRALTCALTCALGVAVGIGPASGETEAGASEAGGSPAAVQAARPITIEAYATYYGWYTNTPPGCATAYSGCAGGVGTYDDPVTLASDTEELPVGTILYYPTVEKYFVMGDDCSECDADWSGHGPDGGPHYRHVDLWTGGEGGSEQRLVACEDALTKSTPTGGPLETLFVVDPPSDLAVSSRPLFDAASSRCFATAVSSSSAVPGHLVSSATGQCLLAPSRAPTRRAEDGVRVGRCRVGPSDAISFEGLTISARGRCLTTTGRPGSRLTWTRCDGGPREQWEMGANGVLAWVQYLRCATSQGPLVVLGPCDPSSRASRWSFEQGYS